ncbi:MAG: glycoside hydrolase family 9 protein [Candidatus Latescibacteria bacterium]|nr:glycoside hydrolase family 9 protein [Candidatus Latescibacterota bacterium]
MIGVPRLIHYTLESIGALTLVCVAALFLLDARGMVRTARQLAYKVIERNPGAKDRVLQLAGFFMMVDREEPEPPQPLVIVDQLGYRPGDPKLALVKGDHARRSFEVVNAATNKAVYTGTIQSMGQPDGSTGDMTSLLDFTPLNTPGTYHLRIPGTALKSYEFRVGDDVYRIAASSTIESFYYQRCGTAVGNGTVWKHPPCHTKDGVVHDNPSVFKDVTGGWHDAGDYGKFVVTGVVSAAYLLYLYEHQPAKFTDRQLAIPEARNGTPDLLDEARWELAWLLKLQRDDGGVPHKVSAKKWTGNNLPQDDPDQRYILGVSSTATAGTAAVTALGARLFDRWDKPFAARLLKASVQAWKFLEAHPDIVPPGGYKNPSDVIGGDYGDRRDTDERLWAAAELYRLTGDDRYHQYFVTHYQQCGLYNYNTIIWQHVENFAYAAYLRTTEYPVDKTVHAALLSNLISHGDRLLKHIGENHYRHILKTDEYFWGSNSLALGYAFDLIQAYTATQQPQYLEGALDQLHYMLGRNTFNKVFITGVGSNPVRYPYHQFSMKLGAEKPVPGLVVGGLNRYDGPNGQALSEFPGKCYQDSKQNYFVNEVAINYTAPLAFVAGYFAQFNPSTP